jgi:hypothetical protein
LITAFYTVKLWQSTSKYQDAVRDEANARTAEAGERAAHANEEAGKANVEAARANESAGKANERAQRLEQENITLRTDLENATAEARRRQTELTVEQQRMAKEQQKTAEAQKQAAQTLLSAQVNLQQVRSFLTPRRLIAGQNREKFLQALKDKPVVPIDILWAGDLFIGEPRQFAEDIADALREAGWTEIKVHGGFVVPDDTGPFNVRLPGGLRIVVKSLDDIPPSTEALSSALFASDFVVDFIPNEKLEGDVIRLMVLMIPADGGRVLHFAPK